jgi:SAM-dependent methyltransferase
MMSLEPPQSAFDQVRRREPRLIDTDWLVLRGLAAEVSQAAAEMAGVDKVAIDFGCGDQPYRRLFEERGTAYRGADLGGVAEIPIGEDGRVDAPSASADLILSFQVLEHVRDLDCYLSEAKRLLRPEGQLLLSTHGTWLYHPHPEDHRRWTREGLISELESRGFAVETCRSVVGPLALTTIIRLTAFAYPLRKIPLVGELILAPLAAMMNLRAAFEDRITPAEVRRDNACVYVVRASLAGRRK